MKQRCNAALAMLCSLMLLCGGNSGALAAAGHPAILRQTVAGQAAAGHPATQPAADLYQMAAAGPAIGAGPATAAGCAAPAPTGGGQAGSNSQDPAASGAASGQNTSSSAHAASSPAASAHAASSRPAAVQQVVVALPAGQAVLGEVLTQLAEADRLRVQVRTVPENEPYAPAVAEMLAGPDAPALVWAEDADAATALGEGALANLLSAGGSPAVQALARLPGDALALRQGGAVVGLPLGFYAEGYLVNLDLLAALLGAGNAQTALLRDLQRCTFAQWSALANALEHYLARPGRMRIKLGENTYQTPDYRPEKAQPVRGMFAVADADAAAMLRGLAEAAMAVSRQATAQAAAEAGENAAQDAAGPVLMSLMAVLDMESMHMGRREGAMRRGEDYAARDVQNTHEEAVRLFVEGTALFLRADSRLGLQLEAENPQLAGKLALVPFKFAPPPQAEEDEQADEDASSEAGEDEAAEATTEAAALQVAELLAQSGQTLRWACPGYLCLTQAAAQSSAAQALLLRLFTTGQGTAATTAHMYLQPFGSLLPATPLARQVAAAAGGTGTRIQTPAGAFALANESLGAYVVDVLMAKADWEDEEIEVFLSTARHGFGHLLEQP